jgi:hypothetical protein
VAHLVKKLPAFCRPESSLLCSIQPTSEPCSEPDESNPHLHNTFDMYFNIILPSKLKSCERPEVFRPNLCRIFNLPLRSACLYPLNFLNFMPKGDSVQSTSGDDVRCLQPSPTLCDFLFLDVQIFCIQLLNPERERQT